MKINKLIIGITLGMALTVLSVHAQTFQNLNFEQANPIIVDPAPFYPYDVTAASALPNWTVYLGTVQQTEVLQNTFTTGQASVDIFGPNYTAAEAFPGNPGTIAGNYSVLLQAGGSGNPMNPQLLNASIAQYGTVPAGSQALEFKAWTTSVTEFSVSFAGNILSPVVLGSGSNYTLYGVNISSYDGDSGTLEFTSIFNGPGIPWLGLDDISFSPTPEPSIVALTAIGGLLFGMRQWFARRS